MGLPRASRTAQNGTKVNGPFTKAMVGGYAFAMLLIYAAAIAAAPPEPKLSAKEEEEVRKVAKSLLETLKKEKLVLDWREKQQARAAVLTVQVATCIFTVAHSLSHCYPQYVDNYVE